MKDPSLGLQIKDRRTHLISSHPKCFVANEAIKWIQTRFGWTQEEAFFFNCLLATRRIIHHTTDREMKFENNGNYWRFQSDEIGPLNWKFIWVSPVEQSPCLVVEQLLKDLLSTLHLAAPREGTLSETLVALSRIGTCNAFEKFERDTAILQMVTLDLPTPHHRISFWVNTYNLLTLHGLITKINQNKDQNPFDGYWERSRFFQEFRYLIGGYHFSLEDIKNGLLRSTVDHFSSEDPRKGLGLDKREPRIHTAITSFTKSSPQPIILYHEKIDFYLNLASKRFFSKTVTFEENAIILPKIVSEFPDDFRINQENVVKFLWPLLQKEQRNQLSKIINKKSSISLKYHDFKWDLSIQVDDFTLIFNKSHRSI